MAGINGGAVAMAGAGAFLIYAGIRNVPLLAGFRDLAAGRLPTPRPADPTKVAFDTGTAGLSPAPVTGAGAVGNAINTAFKYNLGNVKTYVSAAAYEIGPKFGIVTIYGWAPGLFEHPLGRALDFMINTPGLGKAAGDAVAAYVVANAARLKVMYVIWNRRSWNPHRGTWVTYAGPNPHTDHVHVSFN